MSRTMRLRKPVTIDYVAKIVGVNGGSESDPSWIATTQVTGVQVTGDIALSAVADRTSVKNGDLVTFVLKERNASSHVASHVGIFGGVGAGFQMLQSQLGNYGYFFDWSRPKDLQSGSEALSEWTEVRSRELAYTYFSTYAVTNGPLIMSAQLSQLDQLDAETANDLTQLQINSTPASSRITVRQSTLGPSANVGNFVPFVTEIRNEGPERVTGLRLVETISTNLQLSYSSSVTGESGEVVTSFLDSFIRLPPLEPGQNFIWQRSYSTHNAGDAWRRVEVAGFDQTSLGALAQSEATVTVQPVQADLQLEFLDAPTVGQLGIPTRFTVRVRNLGPATATGVKVSVVAPFDALRLGAFGYGPRASIDWLTSDTFQTQLLPGESATIGFNVTPLREGPATGSVFVRQLEQVDPNPANDALSLTLNAGAAPPFPPILRVRKMRTDFFDRTPIAEIEVDQAELNRYAPFTTFWLEGSSNLQDWEFLSYFGLLRLEPSTFTDHALPGVKTRAFRLRTF